MGDKDMRVCEVWIAPVGTSMNTFPEGWNLLGYHPNFIDSPKGDEE